VLPILLMVLSLAEPQGPVLVDSSALTPETYARIDGTGLQTQLVMRLILDGFSLSAVPEKTRLHLVLSERDSQLVLSVPGCERTAEVSATGEDPADELHLEVAHKASALLRGCAELLPPEEKEEPKQLIVVPPPLLPPPPPPPAACPAPPPAPALSAPPTFRWSLGAGASALWRPSALDPLVSVAGAGAPDAGLGFEARAAFVVSRETAVRAQEWQLELGPTWSFPLAQAWTLSTGVLVGGVLHHYELSDSTRTGTLSMLVCSVPAALSWRWTDRLGLQLGVSAGVGGPVPLHVSRGETLWRRGSLRLEGGLQLFWHLPAS